MILTIDIGEIIDEDPDFVDHICEILREQERVHLLRKFHGIEEP